MHGPRLLPNIPVNFYLTDLLCLPPHTMWTQWPPIIQGTSSLHTSSELIISLSIYWLTPIFLKLLSLRQTIKWRSFDRSCHSSTTTWRSVVCEFSMVSSWAPGMDTSLQTKRWFLSSISMVHQRGYSSAEDSHFLLSALQKSMEWWPYFTFIILQVVRMVC